MSRRRLVVLASFLFLVTLTRCASFREDNIRQYPSPAEMPIAKQQSIGLRVYGAVILKDEIYQAHPKTLETWRKQTVRAYEECGFFSEVREEPGRANLDAEVVIVDKGDPNAFLAFITGLTLYLIPSKATDEFSVKTTIRNRDGAVLGTFERRETVTLWQQWFMVFAMPFNWPSRVAKETLYDLNRATIDDAHAEGIL